MAARLPAPTPVPSANHRSALAGHQLTSGACSRSRWPAPQFCCHRLAPMSNPAWVLRPAQGSVTGMVFGVVAEYFVPWEWCVPRRDSVYEYSRCVVATGPPVLAQSSTSYLHVPTSYTTCSCVRISRPAGLLPILASCTWSTACHSMLGPPTRWPKYFFAFPSFPFMLLP